MVNYAQAVIELVGEGFIGGPTNGPIQEFKFKEGTTPPTEETIQAKLSELQNAEPIRRLREERNRKLAQTDWRASSDLTLSSEWKTYRQALRDLPSKANPTLDDNGILQNVTWPKEPT
jgi:hypothetical protein